MAATRTLVILGAGASRSVSYNREGFIPSPLDSDFRDLLFRLEKKPGGSLDNDIRALRSLISALPSQVSKSMERSFYTLHLRALMHRTLGVKAAVTEARVVKLFARSIHALLREAHKKNVCKKHHSLLAQLTKYDCLISFNYDLVPA